MPAPRPGPAQAPPAPQRLHALDAVRAIALLLGIVLHASMSFLPGLADLGWPLADNAPSHALNALFLWIHMFRMPLFFLLAGFFARRVVHSRGEAWFARDRARRILLPLVAGWVLVVPLTGFILIAAAARAGKPLFHPNIPPDSALQLPLAHLWFLYVLLLLYAFFMAARWLLLRAGGRRAGALAAVDGCVRVLCTSPAGVFALALPLAASLYAYPWWWVSLGIPTPDYSLIPNPPALVGYGTAFTLGWLMQRQPALLPVLARRWPVHAGLAVVLTGTCVLVGGTSMAAVIEGDARRLSYALAYCAAGWCWVFAMLGAALRWLPAESARWRYLADASYWMYLVHLPLVFALQAALMHAGLPWPVKFLLILSVTVAVLLLSYGWLVRRSVIGLVLNGRRYPR